MLILNVSNIFEALELDWDPPGTKFQILAPKFPIDSLPKKVLRMFALRR